MKDLLKNSTLFILSGIFLIFVGAVLLAGKGVLSTNYYKNNIHFAYNDTTKADIQELGLGIDVDQVGTYDKLMGDIYPAYIELYNATQDELRDLLPEGVDETNLVDYLTSDEVLQKQLTEGQYTQHMFKEGFKRLSWIQSLERTGGHYELDDALRILATQNTTILNKLVFVIIYYGWMLAFILAFSVIYYGVVVQQINKQTKGYTEDELEDRQTYYDTYYEAYKTQRSKKPKKVMNDDEEDGSSR